ncbi:MAG: hypothetical protein HOH58_05130 [Opitutaceae bacterium]|jgi:hypothetical protein|nr:hypothetical protein [Opitutaceae bacterium]
MTYPTSLRRFVTLLAGFSASISSHAQETHEFMGDDALMMDAFNVSVYGGEIPIIDGISGKKYKGDHPVVIDFALSFNKLLLAYHKKLVVDEYKHMEFRIKLGERFEQEMNVISTAFDFGEFELDRSQWLKRERAIVSRLIHKPFFKISSLIAWDIDNLNEIAPAQPKSKFAADIRFNPETQQWERRVTAKWPVFFRPNPNNANNTFYTDKEQGLNLDTLHGFHYIERGLPTSIIPSAFKDVKLTYPIFYSDENMDEEELRRLQETFIANLYYIYDPFSWVARRETRFRGGYRQDCQKHIEGERIYVSDRKWFNSNFSRFLSDVVTIKLQGAEEIYDHHMVGKRFGESPQILGAGYDPLNWNKKEKRKAPDKPEAIVKLNHKSSWGLRYVLIDAYQRFGDELLDRIRVQLTAANTSRKKINGESMIKAVVSDLAGMPFDDFGKRAARAQEAKLAEFRINKEG